MKLEYDKNTDEVIVYIGAESESISIKDLLSKLPSDMTRLQYLKDKLYETKKNKYANMWYILEKISNMVEKQEGINELQRQALLDGASTNKLKGYSEVIKGYGATKNTLNEARLLDRTFTKEIEWVELEIAKASV